MDPENSNGSAVQQEIVSLNRLPSATVKLLGSSQVITSVSSVIKELMENAVDAGATNIEIKLENHGLSKIEIKDNGNGINKNDVQYMCQRSYTSKINDFSDLDKLSSYGFRGEALSSLCAVGNVSITTKTSTDQVATCYTFNSNGEVVSSSVLTTNKGTSVIVQDLFKNLPVRKQFLTSGKRKNEELKRVENCVKKLALINHGIRVVLWHNKFTIWQKSAVCTMIQSFIQVLPPTIVKQLKEINYQDETATITLMVPQRDCNLPTTCYGNSMEATFLFINSRPVKDKPIEKALQEGIFQFFGTNIPPNKHPTCLASIIVPPGSLDINLEPNKTKVMIKSSDTIIKVIKQLLVDYYIGEEEPPQSQKSTKPSVKRKCKQNDDDDEDLIEVKIPKIIDEDNEGARNQEVIQFSTNGDNSIADNPEQEQKCTEDIRENCLFPDEDTVNINRLSSESYQDKIVDDLNINPEELLVPVVGVHECEIIEDSQINYENSFADDMEGRPTEHELIENPETLPNRENEISNPKKIDGSEITLSQWSRGNVSCNGEVVQGTTVIGRNVENSDLNESSEIFSTQNSTTSQISLERSVSSQMGQRQMSAFTKFARATRSTIINQNPGISFTKVASELASRWKALQGKDKQLYEELALAEKEKAKIKKDLSRFTTSQIMKRKEEKPQKKTYSHVILLKTSLDDIKLKITNRISQCRSQKIEIIATLENNLIIVKELNDLSVFSSHRLKEAIKFQNNLIHLGIPTKVLDVNLEIEKQKIGEDLWEILQSMETVFDVKINKTVISDEKIIKNGFRIEKIEGQPYDRYYITDAPMNIAFYGIEDLKEILEKIKTSNGRSKMKSCRPLKVISYIRSETIRQLSQTSPNVSENYVIDIYRYWSEQVKSDSIYCPHYYPVSKVLYP